MYPGSGDGTGTLVKCHTRLPRVDLHIMISDCRSCVSALRRELHPATPQKGLLQAADPLIPDSPSPYKVARQRRCPGWTARSLRRDALIDGISTRNILPDDLRRSVSAVFQGSRLFQHSLRENITMLDDVPLEQVREVAGLANAAAFIDELVRGYDAQVARGGDNFSSGQAQRIALARALLVEGCADLNFG